MTLESSEWCVPNPAPPTPEDVPSWDDAPELMYVNYSDDLQSGVIDPSNESGTQTFKATTENINSQYGSEYSDVRTEGTPTSLLDTYGEAIRVYEYVDAQNIAVTSDNEWVEGKAYFVKAQKSK